MKTLYVTLLYWYFINNFDTVAKTMENYGTIVKSGTIVKTMELNNYNISLL